MDMYNRSEESLLPPQHCQDGSEDGMKFHFIVQGEEGVGDRFEACFR